MSCGKTNDGGAGDRARNPGTRAEPGQRMHLETWRAVSPKENAEHIPTANLTTIDKQGVVHNNTTYYTTY